MELTYKVRGADAKEYGPASLNDINSWLREGRIHGETQVTRSDIDYWAPASNFSELDIPQTSAVTPAPLVRPIQSGARPVIQPAALAPVGATGSDPATEAQLKSGARWFYYWIAGLSLINSVVAMTGGQWGFLFGLGITQIIDGLGQNIEGGGKAVVLVLDLIAAGVFGLFGVFAHKRQTWAFLLGMLLYALDGLIFLLIQDWLGLGFHGFVLFCLFRGFQACRELNAR
jgi:hypothetical protein